LIDGVQKQRLVLRENGQLDFDVRELMGATIQVCEKCQNGSEGEFDFKQDLLKKAQVAIKTHVSGSKVEKSQSIS
jgi:hypothetical protein